MILNINKHNWINNLYTCKSNREPIILIAFTEKKYFFKITNSVK